MTTADDTLTPDTATGGSLPHTATGGSPPNYAREALALFARYGDAEAIAHGSRRLTYADVVDAVEDLAAAFVRHGVSPGAAVAILPANVPESVLAQLALHSLGCRSVWLAPDAPASLAVQALRRSGVGAFVYDPRTHPDLGPQLAGEVPEVRCLCLGAGGIGPDLTAERAQRPGVALEGPEPESLFQTGGTTGVPKLVHHRHAFFTNLRGAAERHRAGTDQPLRHLATSGLWNASGQATVLLVLFTGGLVVLCDRFDAGDWLATVERERITSATLPPAMLYRVLDHPDLPGTDTSSLAMLSVAGSALAPARLERAVQRFGPGVLPSYGMSEATLIAMYPMAGHDPTQPQRLASCGRPVSSAQVEIRDDDGRVLPPGGTGEVWARALLMTAGYWGEPELTARTLVDGWLRTGDVGYLDTDGYLYLQDRVKDMIPTGLTSANVYSRTVEDALYTHPDVRAAAVIGVPHEGFGEAVHAVVELTDDSVTTPEQLRAWAAERLSEHWAPQSVEIIARLPLTPAGKIDKKVLRAQRRPG